MELLMSGTSNSSSPQTSMDSPNAISSLESVDGLEPSDSPAGQTIGKSGLEAAPASPSLKRARGWERKTRVTFGRSSAVSSGSADLQLFLESRLRVQMAGFGSMEYSLTWKHWPMSTVPPICALRASGRRTSDNDYGGWPTPNAMLENRGGLQTNPIKAMERKAQGHMLNLDDVATMAGWNTPRATDGSNGGPNQAGGALSSDAAIAGWATPNTCDATRGSPETNEAKIKRGAHPGQSLIDQAALAGWATPTSRDHKDTTSAGTVPVNGLLGRQVWGSGIDTNSPLAEMENRGALNPAHSRWLMGYPVAWDSCGATAMQSCRKSRRNSSRQRKTPS